MSDDPVGIGVYGYYIARNGVGLGVIPGAEYGDSSVSPSTTYTYRKSFRITTEKAA